MTPNAPARHLRRELMQTLDLSEYEALKLAVQRAYVQADDNARVTLSFAYLKLFPRTVEADTAELTLDAPPRQLDTRECSTCGITVPTPNRPDGIPCHWTLDPRSALLVCGACDGRRLAAGWRPPAGYEIGSYRLEQAREALRTDREAQR